MLMLAARRRRLRQEVLLLPLALLACAMSVAALVGAGARAVPPPVLIAPQDRLALVGIELLLPHLARGAAFARPFSLAFSLAEGDAELTLLLRGIAPLAAAGAPTARALADAFPSVAEAAIAQEAGFDPDGDLARLAVRAMRLGAAFGAGGSPAMAATRLAEAALQRGDLNAAHAALAGLRGPPAVVDWRARAGLRIAADAGAEALVRLAAARAGGGA